MILTDDKIRKAAESAAEQMWPESGYVGWTKDDVVFHRKFIEACLEKLRGGVEVPEAIGDGFTALMTVGDTPSLMEQKRICVSPIAVCSLESALQYGAAQRLAGQQRETCTWAEQDDKDMPGTYESSCGEMWSFIDGGVKENRVTYCHHCGGKVVPASPQEQT